MVLKFLADSAPNVASIDDYIVKFFNDNLGIFGNILLAFLCILLACVLSGMIGYERESHGHAAGLRTHILVAAGSALVMYLSIYAFDYNFFPNHDPARLAAQVVTGIGFLGAGAIMKTGVDIKGLTTATTIWVSMTIGLAAGAGRFVVAIFSTIIVLVVLKFLRRMENRAFEKTPRLTMICSYDTCTLKTIKEIAEKYNVLIRNISTTICSYNGQDAVSITVSMLNAKTETINLLGEDLRLSLKPFEIKY